MFQVQPISWDGSTWMPAANSQPTELLSSYSTNADVNNIKGTFAAADNTISNPPANNVNENFTVAEDFGNFNLTSAQLETLVGSTPALPAGNYSITKVDSDNGTASNYDDDYTMFQVQPISWDGSTWMPAANSQPTELLSSYSTNADVNNIKGNFAAADNTISNPPANNVNPNGNGMTDQGLPTYVDQTTTTTGHDRVTVNTASSTLSGMVDAAEGLDELHLEGLSLFSNSSKDIYLDENDSTVTSTMIADSPAYWDVGQHYSEISLGNTLDGRVDVWTQTPEIYNGNFNFDTVIGILDKSQNKIIASGDQDASTMVNSGNYSSSSVMDVINNTTRQYSDSYVSFTASPNTEYSVLVGDWSENHGYLNGGAFDLYAVSGVNTASETLVLSEVVLGENAGALVDFSAGIQGQLNSAFVTSYGADGGSVGFEIDNFEKITLTDTADYVYVTGDVGHGLGTSYYSSTYFSTSQSGLIIDLVSQEHLLGMQL